ncbi:MAG: AMIN domain-containing protein [Oculatellaceae cyanobacterium bins.114]|nr:AMIN domain-containing protein [Oculatellaceae cyanobacterium bins.114]
MQKAQFGQRFWLSLGLMGLSIAGHPVTVALGLGAIALTVPAPSYAAVLTGWRFNTSNAELEITVPAGVTPRYFLLAQPARIVLDLPNTTIGSVPAVQTYSGRVRQIRVNEFQPGVTRIVIELSPDVVLAAQQVDLREIGQGRWVVRPRFAGDAAPVAAQPIPRPAATVAPAPIPSVQPAPVVEPAPVAEPPETVRDPILVQPPSTTAVVPPPSSTPAAPATSLPPLESGATEIPVEIAEPDAPVVAAPETATPEPTPEVAIAPQPAPVVTPAPTAPLTTPSPAPYDPQLPTTLPPANFSGDRPVTVQVPELGSAPARPAPVQPPIQPPVQSPPVQSPPVQLPVLPPASSTPNQAIVPPVAQPPVTQPPSVIPVPVPSPASVAVAPNPTVLLPSGTVLRLRYPRESVLELQAGSPWQEVLVLNQALRDRSGNIIAPEGSPVIGRFETDQTGSRFVAQAITLQGQNMRLMAQSSRLGGDRQVSEQELVRNSAIGGLALTVLGAFTGIGAIAGVVAGAAAGAATTYITAPQPAIIQPNQIVEVRLIEDLPRPQ